MSARVSYKKQILFGIMMLLSLLTVVEIAARIYEIESPPCYLLEREALAYLEPELKKQICLDSYFTEYYDDPIKLMKPNQHFETLNINSHGFRGPEIKTPKPDNTFRIFLVGGSTAMSQGSPSDEISKTGFMQVMFDNEDLNVDVEVINGATGGHRSLDENWVVKNKILQLEPDLIIFFDGGNDVRYRYLDTVVKSPEEKKQENPLKFKSYPFYRTPFVVYRIIINPTSEQPLTDQHISQIPINWKNNISEICEIGKKENFQVIVALQPLNGAGNKTKTTDEARNAPENDPFIEKALKLYPNMKKRLTELDSICDKTADLTNVFDHIDEAIYWDGLHVNAKGHEIVAKKLFELSLPMVKEIIEK